MLSYFIRRLLLIIPTFIGITLLIFAITRIMPGGPVESILQELQINSSNASQNLTLSKEQINDLKSFYGLDKPILEAYVVWLKKVLVFDLGISTRFQDPVVDLIKDRLPISLFYGVVTVFLTYIICIPLGILKVFYHGRYVDGFSSVFIFIGYAIPSYVLAVLLISIFAYRLDIFPITGFVSDNFLEMSSTEKVKDIIWHAVLPITSYVAGNFAMLTMLMKNSLMETLSKDYMRTAIAKGLSFKKAVLYHALRNAFVPIATGLGSILGVVLGGSFLIESIFNIDGIGLLGYESIIKRDYPVVMGILVISSILYLLGNIVSDFCVALVDPRIRFG